MDPESPTSGDDADVVYATELVTATGVPQHLLQQRPAPLAPQQQESEPLAIIAQSARDGAQMAPGQVFPLAADQEGTCVSVSQDAAAVAVGCRSGEVLLLAPGVSSVLATLGLDEAPAAVVTAVRFRPAAAGGSCSSLLLVAKGTQLLQLHAGTGSIVTRTDEGHNNLNNIAVSSSHQLFATAGSNGAVRVYDDSRRQAALVLSSGDGQSCCGHTSAVFGLAWHPADTQVLLSAGWDGTVQVWDLRACRAVRSLAGGSYVCGDALDVQGSRVLTGSWRSERSLQLWDLGSGRLLTNLPFHQPRPEACLPYAARFGPGGMMVAGGSGQRPLLRTYNKKGHLLSTLQTASAVHAVDWAASTAASASSGSGSSKPGGDLLAVCCARQVHLMSDAASGSP